MIIQIDQSFFEMCEQQLNKIDLFFKMKLADAQRKENELKRDLEAFEGQGKVVLS